MRLTGLCLVLAAATLSAEPVATTVCEIAQSPGRFHGKLVTLHSRVLIAFEDFELSAADCPKPKIDRIWLEYGKGPKSQPTVWCCGDTIPRDELTLVQNNDFRAFHRYLTAQRGKKGCKKWQCYSFSVTATITGRFDAAETRSCPNGTGECCSGGFGHFGLSCGRLVIQGVSKVEAERVP
jgi:hypothetical protein